LSQTACAGVYRNGYKVYAENFVGDDNSAWILWSVTKAVTATLFGIAERDGLCVTEDFCSSRGIREWLTTNAINVTIDQIQRHDSGRYYDFFTDFIRSQLQPSQTQFGIDLPQQHEPMEIYQYNQMAIQTLERVLETVFGEPVPTTAARELFDVLGFEGDHTFWQEWPITSELWPCTVPPCIPGENPYSTDPLTYAGVWTHCDDLARFGVLWLNKGQWTNGTTVFTEEYWNKALINNPDGRPGRRYHWGGPPNYRANGLGDQLVTFNLEENLVITRLGDPFQISFSGSEFINMVLASITNRYGTTNYDMIKDELEGGMPKEEKLFQSMLIDMGFAMDMENGKMIMNNDEALHNFHSDIILQMKK